MTRYRKRLTRGSSLRGSASFDEYGGGPTVTGTEAMPSGYSIRSSEQRLEGRADAADRPEVAHRLSAPTARRSGGGRSRRTRPGVAPPGRARRAGGPDDGGGPAGSAWISIVPIRTSTSRPRPRDSGRPPGVRRPGSGAGSTTVGRGVMRSGCRVLLTDRSHGPHGPGAVGASRGRSSSSIAEQGGS